MESVYFYVNTDDMPKIRKILSSQELDYHVDTGYLDPERVLMSFSGTPTEQKWLMDKIREDGIKIHPGQQEV